MTDSPYEDAVRLAYDTVAADYAVTARLTREPTGRERQQQAFLVGHKPVAKQPPLTSAGSAGQLAP